jgi:hypothetical protein
MFLRSDLAGTSAMATEAGPSVVAGEYCSEQNRKASRDGQHVDRPERHAGFLLRFAHSGILLFPSADTASCHPHDKCHAENYNKHGDTMVDGHSGIVSGVVSVFGRKWHFGKKSGAACGVTPALEFRRWIPARCECCRKNDSSPCFPGCARYHELLKSSVTDWSASRHRRAR